MGSFYTFLATHQKLRENAREPVAQSSRTPQGGIQTRGLEAPDRKGDWPWEILYFKAYKSQLPVIEQALETAGLMLGSTKSRGYCLEMICANFLAGVSLEAGNQDALLPCLIRLVIGLPKPQRKQLIEEVQITF
jgi:hypothetical protein